MTGEVGREGIQGGKLVKIRGGNSEKERQRKVGGKVLKGCMEKSFLPP